MSEEEQVLELAREVGFDLCGIAPLAPPPDAGRFADWLDRGHHAGMDYLERNRERILDPRRLLPEGRSMLVVGLAHSRAALELEGGARVARYAAGRDYHNVMGKMLRKLARRMDDAGLGGRRRAVVDAGPLLERSHAEHAGLGFASKAANLLHPRFGPWFFLGELLLEIELAPTGPTSHGSCGTCTACIDTCPTAAIVEPGRVDAGRCISYQTIENRASIPREIRADMDGWAFGCDVCSEVCPWGQAAPELSERFGTHRVLDGGLVSWLEPREQTARSEWIRGSPLQRPKRAGLARNAAIALGHLPSEEGRRALLQALSFDPSSIVRESAAWALARAHAQDVGVRAAIGKQLGVEQDESARDDMRISLDEAP